MGIFGSEGQIERGAQGKLFRVVFLFVLCAFFAFANSCTSTNRSTQRSPVEAQSRTAEQPRVTQIDDARIKQLLKPNGKPLLVNFWATWCGPCREEFPDLVEIDAQYRGKIDFFTVSLDFIEEINTTVPEFLSEIKAEMPTYLLTSADENALISSISKDWNGALPFTILYNQNGDVAFLRQGKVDPAKLKGEVEKVLGE